jgi:hypothetical protein
MCARPSSSLSQKKKNVRLRLPAVLLGRPRVDGLRPVRVAGQSVVVEWRWWRGVGCGAGGSATAGRAGAGGGHCLVVVAAPAVRMAAADIFVGHVGHTPMQPESMRRAGGAP